MIVASTLVALPLLAIALVARRFRSDLEEAAWRLMAVTMLVIPFASLVPKVDVGFQLPIVGAEPEFPWRGQPELPTDASLPIPATIYVVVASLLLARLAIAAVAAWRLRRDAKPFGRAYLSTSVRVPVTAGLIAPVILLPTNAASWGDSKLAAVLAHERAHVIRRDPLWRLIGRAAVAVSWFNPLAWLAAASIERIAEETADREAIEATGDRHEYANFILDFLRVMSGHRRRILTVSMLDGRALGERIDAILRPARTRPSRLATRILLTSLVAGGIFMTAMTTNVAPPEIIRMQQQEERNLELLRKRDEIRDQARKHVRETLQALFRDFD